MELAQDCVQWQALILVMMNLWFCCQRTSELVVESSGKIL